MGPFWGFWAYLKGPRFGVFLAYFRAYGPFRGYKPGSAVPGLGLGYFSPILRILGLDFGCLGLFQRLFLCIWASLGLIWAYHRGSWPGFGLFLGVLSLDLGHF